MYYKENRQRKERAKSGDRERSRSTLNVFKKKCDPGALLSSTGNQQSYYLHDII